MPRIAKPPIPAKLYRHFAAVTLALTFALAMFTDGEQRQATAQEADTRQQLAQAAQATAQAPRKLRLKLAAPAPTTIGTFGEDVQMGSATTPMDHSRSGIIPSGAGPSAIAGMAAARALGYPPAQLAAMSPAERAQLIKGLRSAGLLDPEERKRKAALLKAGSAARSGTQDHIESSAEA